MDGKMTEQEKAALAQLMELVKQNPELDVITMVDADVVADCYPDIWRGWLSAVSIDEVLDGEEATHIRSIADPEAAICDYLNSEEAPAEIEKEYVNASDEAEIKRIYDKLPWKKIILLKIST